MRLTWGRGERASVVMWIQTVTVAPGGVRGHAGAAMALTRRRAGLGCMMTMRSTRQASGSSALRNATMKPSRRAEQSLQYLAFCGISQCERDEVFRNHVGLYEVRVEVRVDGRRGSRRDVRGGIATFIFQGHRGAAPTLSGGKVGQGAVGAAGIETTPGRVEPTTGDATAPGEETMAPCIDGGRRMSRGFTVSIM